MGLKDILDRYFPKKKGEIETGWRTADEIFRKEKASSLEKSRERGEKMREKTFELVEELGKGVEAFDDYDDSQDLQIVEDVAQNFYRTRKRMIEEFEASNDDMEQHLEDLQEFLDEFNDVSRKEGEVMKHVRKDSEQLSTVLDEIIQHREDMENFVETEHQVLNELEMVEEYIQEIEELEKKLEEKNEKLEGKDTRDIKEDIENIEEKLDEIESSDEWKQMKSMEREKKELEKKKNRKLKQVKSDISEMDRGLKKLVYNIENEGLSFEGSKKVLKKLEEREMRDIDSIEQELKESREKIREEDLLDGKDREKFMNGAEGLEDFHETMQKVSELEKEIQDIEERLEGLDVEEKKKELKDRKKKFEDDLKEKKEEVRTLEEDRNNTEIDFRQKIMELEHFMNSLMRGDIHVREIKEEWRK